MLQVNSLELLDGASPLTSNFGVIAGPCSLESLNQVQQIAAALKGIGISGIRGGIWKMRTDPRSFQGLGEEALPILQWLKEEHFQLVSEVTDPRLIEWMIPWVSCFQVGARNMYNYSLLRDLAQTRKPILLKRSFSATVSEWIKACEYLEPDKNTVILCERGIRTFETKARFTLDLNGALIAKTETKLPVYIDPSHGIGLREYVPQLVWATAAAGLDGVLIEVHPEPEKALSDGRQSITLSELQSCLRKLDMILQTMGRKRCNPLGEKDHNLENEKNKEAKAYVS